MQAGCDQLRRAQPAGAPLQRHESRPFRPARITPEALLSLLKQRARRILSVAAENREDILILGAFGCGAFRNPPETAAHAWAEVLPEFSGVFEKVHFAVYCRPDDMRNYLVFDEALNAPAL